MPVILQRIWIQITGDRRRFVLLCAVAAIGLLLWSRIILISNIPRTAVADPDKHAAGGGGSASGRELSDNLRPLIRLPLPRTPLRDPFGRAAALAPKSGSADQNNEDTGKLGRDRADLSGVATADQALMLKSEAARYKLEALMPGQDLAVINGHVCRTGMQIQPPDSKNPMAASFTLVEVKARSVVIEHEGHSFELTLEPPKVKQESPELRPEAGSTQSD